MRNRSLFIGLVLLQAGLWSAPAMGDPQTAATEPAPSQAAPPSPGVRQSTPIPNDSVTPRKPRHKVPDLSPEDAADVSAAQALERPPSHRCFVRDLMAFYDRTHVRCYNRARGNINFFAVDTGQPVAETLLTKAWKAMRSGKPLTITYAPTADLNPASCDPHDCRRLIDVLN